jgi:hypothetical protein
MNTAPQLVNKNVAADVRRWPVGVRPIAPPSSRRGLQQLLLAVLLLTACFADQDAFACSTCFGAPDSPMTKSMQAGIWVMIGITGVVLGCIGAFMIYLARRARQCRDAETLDFGFIHNNERVH